MYLEESRGESLCKSTYSPRESSRFLSVVPSPATPSSLAIVSLGERPSRFLSREVSRPDPSLSPRLSANDAITLQENAVRLRSRYEIIPGGLASRKFITINRTRSDEHLAPQPTPGVLRARNSALRILQGRSFLRPGSTRMQR